MEILTRPAGTTLPMRVLHVVPTYLPANRYGGPIQSVHGLCAGLARLGHEVHVYTTNVDGPSVSDVPIGTPVSVDGVSVTYFATAAGRRLYRSPTLRAALRRNLAGFDVLHTHSVFLWPTNVAAATARHYGVPYVLSPRGMLVPHLILSKSTALKHAWIELFERHNLAAAAAVHVTSEIEMADIQRVGLAVRRFVMIPNGVELRGEAQSNYGAADNRATPIVLFLGRINWKKGLDRLIPAMAHVPDAELIIAGNDDENYQPELLALAERFGVMNRTRFVGPLYGAAKWAALANADLVVLPSYSENFGIVVLEAMASGVPVIVTPEVGLAVAVFEAGAGLVVEGEAKKIGDAILELISKPDVRRRMGDAGRHAASARFSWEFISDQMAEIYADVRVHSNARTSSKSGTGTR